MTERRKNQSEEWTYFTLLFITFLKTVNKYRFCISVIGYINIQIFGIGYTKSILVDHYSLLYLNAIQVKIKCFNLLNFVIQ